MKTLLLIGALIAITIVAYVILSINRTSVNVGQKEADTEDNPYLMLRSAALEMKSATLNLQTSENDVFGVVMDWGLEEGTSTLVVFATGDVSMYLSSGGGMIGGITHEEVRKAGGNLLSLSQKMVQNAAPVENMELPAKNFVRFYFLTDKGILVAEESMVNFDNGSSKWLELFIGANEVITEFTKVAPQ